MAEQVLERLQVTRRAREIVLFLIRHHLRMSLAAFRRDTEDPDIVKQFAALVGTEERLKMLCLMTLVDIEAVSPETLTPWKAELLWRLYVDTYNHLTQRYGDELIERNEAGLTELQANRPDDVSATEITRFLEGPAAALSARLSARHDLPAHPACARHQARRGAPLARAEGRDLGARGRDARQAVPVLEHLRRALVVRHEHPARPCVHEPQRARARRVRVHGRGAVPRAESRCARRRCCTSCRTSCPGAPT